MRTGSRKEVRCACHLHIGFPQFLASYMVLMAPFGYEWLFHLPIVTRQFIASVVFVTALESRRPRPHLEWRGVVLRLGVGTLFLIAFLSTTLYRVPVFFAVPSIFDVYSIVIGDVTDFACSSALKRCGCQVIEESNSVLAKLVSARFLSLLSIDIDQLDRM